jgi:hypothetical protein
MVQLEEKNKEFFNEINSGIILWEERDEDWLWGLFKERKNSIL